jgi:hypothetical protein
MQKVAFSFPLTRLQRLFVEKVLELSHLRSLDSYRAKVTCPSYMLAEFYSVLDDFQKGKIKYIQTLLSFRDELLNVVEEDYLLEYSRMSKDYFSTLLKSLKDESSTAKYSSELEHALYFLIVTNSGYIKANFGELKHLLQHTKQILCESCEKAGACLPNCNGCEVTHYYEVERLAGTLVSELLNYGWSKQYIHKYVKGKFAQSSNFDQSWQDFEHEFSGSPNKDIVIVFKLHGVADKLSKFNGDELKPQLNEVYLPAYDRIIKDEKLEKWLRPYGTYRFMVIQTDALDFQQAMKKAKAELSNLLDLMHLGYSETKLTVDSFALVYNTSKLKRFDLYPINYAIDGAFKSDTSNYRQLKNKVELIKSRSFVAHEAKDKIETAIRYLRAGSEALELEQKFLNYWIGLENIFSNNKPTDRTFERIVKFFTTAHSISYTKRNLTEFHKDIRRVGALRDVGVKSDTPIHYLEDVAVFDKIISLGETYPLLSQRARVLKSAYFVNHEKRKIYLAKHCKNLERHLVRMYRVRNQLVHDAAIMQNIESVSGSLRYYLTFILNKLIDFLSDCKEKPLRANQVTMDDFFTHQELVWTNLKKNELKINELLQVPHSVDFIL